MKIKSLYKYWDQYTHMAIVLIPPSRSATWWQTGWRQTMLTPLHYVNNIVG